MELSMGNARKRLAIFLPGLYGGGGERVMLNLAAGLAARCFTVDLILAQAEGAYLDEIPTTVQLVELVAKHRKVLRTVGSLPALIGYLRRQRPAVLLSAMHANIVAIWAAKLCGMRQRVVISEHNTFSRHSQSFPSLYRRLTYQMIRRFYPQADGIVAVSRGVADDLAQILGIAQGRIRVIYNPVITPEVTLKAGGGVNDPWLQPGELPVVLGIGRLSEQKDFTTLIKAFAKVRETVPARLIILGEGEERNKLEGLVRQLALQDCVRLPGFSANPYPYMVHASVFVLSSKWEGLPTVLIEALYCGCKVVSTDCPSGPREIMGDGLSGQLVPIGDVTSMCRAVRGAIMRPAGPTPKECWKPFELESAVDQYISILMGF